MSNQALKNHSDISMNRPQAASIPLNEHCEAARIAMKSKNLMAAEKAAVRELAEADNDAAAKRAGKWGEISNRHDIIRDELVFLDEQATHVQARSALGALFQLSQISTIANTMADEALNDRAREKAERSLDRMIWSIAGFIEVATGVKFATVPGSCYINENQNHHATIDRLIGGGKTHTDTAVPIANIMAASGKQPPCAVARLWDERPELQQAYHDKNFEEEALRKENRTAEATAAEKEAIKMHSNLWTRDETMMASPVSSLQDIALKARLVKLRRDDSGFHDALVAKLLDDIINYLPQR